MIEENMNYASNLNLKSPVELENEIISNGMKLTPELLKEKLKKLEAEEKFDENEDKPSKLNPEMEILSESDPEEIKIRKAIEDKFSHNKKNKNQPL